jgi:uncharacterized protein (DUF1697 family)
MSSRAKRKSHTLGDILPSPDQPFSFDSNIKSTPKKFRLSATPVEKVINPSTNKGSLPASDSNIVVPLSTKSSSPNISRYICFLRAINVAGTNKMSMDHLKNICNKAGYKGTKTYIQTGNVTFTSHESHINIQQYLESHTHTDIFIKNSKELKEILNECPYLDQPPNKVIIFFLPESITSLPSPSSSLSTLTITNQTDEQLCVSTSYPDILYCYYPRGQGISKIKIKNVKLATGRNINTIRKMIELADQLPVD